MGERDKCPFGRVGDIVPVADGLHVRITAIRVEKLEDITEEDAKAEGITDGGCLKCGEPEAKHPTDGPRCYSWNPCNTAQPSYTDSFVRLWESANGEGSWHANPWVWVIEFQPEGGAD